MRIIFAFLSAILALLGLTVFVIISGIVLGHPPGWADHAALGTFGGGTAIMFIASIAFSLLSGLCSKT